MILVIGTLTKTMIRKVLQTGLWVTLWLAPAAALATAISPDDTLLLPAEPAQLAEPTALTLISYEMPGPGEPGHQWYAPVDLRAHPDTLPRTYLPEPGALALFALGLLLVSLSRLWRSRRPDAEKPHPRERESRER